MFESTVVDARADCGLPTATNSPNPSFEIVHDGTAGEDTAWSVACNLCDAGIAHVDKAMVDAYQVDHVCVKIEVARDEHGATAICRLCREAIYRTSDRLAEQWAAGHQCRPDDQTVTTTARPAWAIVSAPHDEVVAIDHSRPASHPIVSGDDVLLPVLYCTDVLANNLDGTMSVMRSEPCIEIKDSTNGRGVFTLDAARALRDGLTELLAVTE